MKINTFSSTLSCIVKSIIISIMISKKIILILFFFGFLNGCVQNTAMLGPVFTYSSSGSVFQTGLSYGSNKLIRKHTKNKKNKKSLKNKDHELHSLLKIQITKTRKKLGITK